jgi:hypothetical protein
MLPAETSRGPEIARRVHDSHRIRAVAPERQTHMCLLDRQFPYQLPFGEPTGDYPSRASE